MMPGGIKTIMTPSGKTERASTAIIVEWIGKAWKEVPVNIIPKSFLKSCLSDVEDAKQDDIPWDNSEQSGASSSENESATEGSLDELSD
jgi:hypothetical protein